MTTILYIAGWGRSGTTLLDNLLGQVEGVVSTGELHHLWSRGLQRDRLCGCGRPLRACPVWAKVFEAGFGGLDAVDAAEVIRAQAGVRTRGVRALLRAQRRGELPARYPYAGHLRRLYDGIARVSGARVVVDSSKFPCDAIVAAALPGYQVRVLHLVRDPRAVAHSWQRRKRSPGKTADGGLMTRVGLVRSSLVWLCYNFVIARYVRRAVGDDRYRRLAYERLATEPAAVLDELLAFVGEAPAHRPALAGHRVELATSHTASGNPGRFATGSVEIRLDDEWRQAMPGWRRALVSLLTLPQLRAMGYRWRTSAAAGAAPSRPSTARLISRR